MWQFINDLFTLWDKCQQQFGTASSVHWPLNIPKTTGNQPGKIASGKMAAFETEFKTVLSLNLFECFILRILNPNLQGNQVSLVQKFSRKLSSVLLLFVNRSFRVVK